MPEDKKPVLTPKAMECAETAGKALRELTSAQQGYNSVISSGPLHSATSNRENVGNALAGTASHIGNKVFDECMGGASVTASHTPRTAPNPSQGQKKR